MRRRYRRRAPRVSYVSSPQRAEQSDSKQADSTLYKLFDCVSELADRTKLPVSNKNSNLGYSTDCFLKEQARWLGRKISAWADLPKSIDGVWPEGLAILERMRNEIANTQLPMPVSRRRKLRWSEDNGDEVDNDRMRSGQKYWRESHRATRRGPATRTIVVDIGANCNVDPEDILWRGAAAVALTEALEEAGYRIELWAVWRTCGCFVDYESPSDCMIGVKIKAPSDQLEVATLVNAVSGWFFRTAFFHELQTTDCKCSGGLGYSTQPGPAQYDAITTDPDRLCIDGVWSYNDAVALIRRELSTLAG